MKAKASIDSALRVYDKHRGMFEDIGFKRDVAERICSIARLGIWDIYWLFRRMSDIPNNGIYLEVGSAEGGSIMLADEARKASGRRFEIIAISLLDPTTREDFFKNTQHIEFRFIENYSRKGVMEIKNASINLLFLDGGKKYETVKSDLLGYWEKVEPNGVLFGHDFDWDYDIKESPWGTLRAVTEFFQLQEIVRPPRGTTLYKVKKC